MKILENAGSYLATACASYFLGFFGASFYRFPPATSADFAAWAGAIGTVGTLIGTIWLATAAERTRTRELSARAAVAASALQLRIASVLKIVQDVSECLSNNQVKGFQYSRMAESIAKADMWSDEEVLPLMILPRNVTSELVASRDVLRHCVDLLRSGNPANILSPARNLDIEREAICHLRQVAASLNVAASECHQFVVRTLDIQY